MTNNSVEQEPTILGGQLPKTTQHFIFLHLDLGIGGAEQLVLNLASASLNEPEPKDIGCGTVSTSSTSVPEPATSTTTTTTTTTTSQEDEDDTTTIVDIYTSHCNPTHCFDIVKPPNGTLSKNVKIYGTFIPQNLFGKGTAFCSTLRMIYITFMAIYHVYQTQSKQREQQQRQRRQEQDTVQEDDDEESLVFVLDVLPTSIPLIKFWLPYASILFYCHFPDKLLTRDTINGIQITQSSLETSSSGSTLKSIFLLVPKFLKTLYRSCLDWLEEYTMNMADMIVVNSNFTKSEVGRVFPRLMSPVFSFTTNDGNHDHRDSSERQRRRCLVPKIKVLYPCIDLSKFIPPPAADDKTKNEITNRKPIVSLNRFERKKNIELLLYGYHLLFDKLQKGDTTLQAPPPLIIAGGYDVRNLENVEYLEELKRLAFETLKLPSDKVKFCPSISDGERSQMLQQALCVCYTPHREHFGIVPLEAMYAGTPVIAIRSGGPMETVIDGTTGYLVDYHDVSNTNLTQKGFCHAMYQFVSDSKLSKEMGYEAHLHVKRKFGLEKFQIDWWSLVKECQLRTQFRLSQTHYLFRQQRQRNRQRQQRIILHPSIDSYVITFLEFITDLTFVILLIWIIRRLGLLPNGYLNVLKFKFRHNIVKPFLPWIVSDNDETMYDNDEL